MQDEQTAIDVPSWLNWVKITSVPLRQLSETNLPAGIASGCLLDYRGKRFISSVRHAVAPTDTNWVIEEFQDLDSGLHYYKPHEFRYLTAASSVEDDATDLCFAQVPADFVSYYQYITPRQGIVETVPRHVFDLSRNTFPMSQETYAFAGQVMPEMAGSSALTTTMCVFPGLKFVAEENGCYLFALPVRHPGHALFKGCSGAPIVDMEGRAVGFVRAGFGDRNLIAAVSLSTLKSAIDRLYNT